MQKLHTAFQLLWKKGSSNFRVLVFYFYIMVAIPGGWLRVSNKTLIKKASFNSSWTHSYDGLAFSFLYFTSGECWMRARQRHKGNCGIGLLAHFKMSTGPFWQFSLSPLVSQDYSVLCTNFGETCCCMQRRRWHPTPVLLPGKSHGQRSLVGCCPWGR